MQCTTERSTVIFGHPIARAAERWWEQHGGEPGDPEWAAYLSDFRDLLPAKFAELNEEHVNDGRFGMSKAGGCTRGEGLKWLGAEREPLSGSTKHTFYLGHVLEVSTLALFTRLGFPIRGLQQPVRIDPFMHSFHDGLFDLHAAKTVLSVKSAGYKKSGKEYRKSGPVWVRRGFPELPFQGVKVAQPGWFAQLQAEMHAEDAEQGLIFVTSKDIIKAMEGDPYLGPEGNGSLTFYAELIRRDDEFIENHLLPVWQDQWDAVQAGDPGPARFLNGATGYYVDLNEADTSWKPNADRTGTFNPCLYCEMFDACKAAIQSA